MHEGGRRAESSDPHPLDQKEIKNDERARARREGKFVDSCKNRQRGEGGMLGGAIYRCYSRKMHRVTVRTCGCVVFADCCGRVVWKRGVQGTDRAAEHLPRASLGRWQQQ